MITFTSMEWKSRELIGNLISLEIFVNTDANKQK